jgi:hypothetical protein
MTHPGRLTAQRTRSPRAPTVKEGVRDAADKVSDTVEDMIPGDSDRDGH